MFKDSRRARREPLREAQRLPALHHWQNGTYAAAADGSSEHA
jgi:hypothetical protein